MVRIHKQIIFQADLDTLWDIITNNENYSWRSNIKEIKIIDNKNFIEVNKNGLETAFTVVTYKKNKKYEIDYENEDLKGHWVGLFYSTSQGVEVDMVEEVESKKALMTLFVPKELKVMREIYTQDIRRELVKRMKEAIK